MCQLMRGADAAVYGGASKSSYFSGELIPTTLINGRGIFLMLVNHLIWDYNTPYFSIAPGRPLTTVSVKPVIGEPCLSLPDTSAAPRPWPSHPRPRLSHRRRSTHVSPALLLRSSTAGLGFEATRRVKETLMMLKLFCR